MPAERLSMRKIREVLRLRFAQGLSQRAIGVSLGLSTGAVNSYLGRARMVDLNWPLADEFSDAELDEYERLLEALESDLLAWLTGVSAVPPASDTAMLRRLRDFHLRGAA